MRLDIGKHQCGRYRPDVDADDPYPLLVQMQKPRPASTRDVAAGALFYPILLDQLLGNDRYGTALKTRMSGQVGTGDGFVAPDQVKDDPPVNVAGGFTCRHLEIEKVDLSHSAERDVDNSAPELYPQRQLPANQITEEVLLHQRIGGR
jgi:hypothetical protein